MTQKVELDEMNFSWKKRKEYNELLSKPIYKKAIIRIKFPNNLLLQAHFALMERVSNIAVFLREEVTN